jgi:pyruvate dehydrogenase (quinone)
VGSVAEVLVDRLVRAGARRVYGVVGDSLNSVVDAVRRTEGIEWVSVRHEEVAAYAAGAEAQVTGRLAVCAGSCGPGNLHLINGLYDSHRSYAPVVAIAAQIPSDEIGTTFFQETHPERILRECSHYCELVGTPDQIGRVADRAIETSLARRGVSVVVLPGDIATRAAPGSTPPDVRLAGTPRLRPSDGALDQLAALVGRSKRVTIFAGAGCADARTELFALADRLKSPIVHTLRGKQHVQWGNPFDVGMTGLLGLAPGYHAMHACDLLLLLGTDFPYDSYYPRGIAIAQVDVRGDHLGRRAPIALGIEGDVRTTIEALLPKVPARSDRSHLDRALTEYRTTVEELDAHARASDAGPLHPQFVAAAVSRLADPKTLFTVDTGMTTVWAARYLGMPEGRGLIGSFNHGSMANALAQAIGAQSADRARPVVALCGDGGLGMLLGDLLTVVEHDLPIKIVVFNNSALGMVKLEMQVAGFPTHGTDFKPVQFARIAEAAGIPSIRVERAEDVEPSLRRTFSARGPALADVVTTPLELALPPDPSLREGWGLGLFALREVMLGHARDVLEEIRTNT